MQNIMIIYTISNQLQGHSFHATPRENCANIMIIHTISATPLEDCARGPAHGRDQVRSSDPTHNAQPEVEVGLSSGTLENDGNNRVKLCTDLSSGASWRNALTLKSYSGLRTVEDAERGAREGRGSSWRAFMFLSVTFRREHGWPGGRLNTLIDQQAQFLQHFVFQIELAQCN